MSRRCWASLQRGLRRGVGVAAQVVAGLLEPVDLASARCDGAGDRSSRTCDQVVLPRSRRTVSSCVVGAAPASRRRSRATASSTADHVAWPREPGAAQRRQQPAPRPVRRRSAARRRGSAARVGLVGSGVEEVPADRGDVGEDPDAEDDDDAGGQLGADAELVAEEDDERRDHDVADERDHEDLVVEDAVEEGAQRAEDRVERGDDGDRQVGLQPERHVRLRGQPERGCR